MRLMRWPLYGLIAALGLTGSAAADPGDLFLDISLEEALKRAKETNKPVMADFYADWCAPCKQLDVQTFADDKVAAWIRENVIPIKIDGDKEVDLRGRYKVRSYPTNVFIGADGEEIGRVLGFRPPERFIEIAEQALQGLTELERARKTFEAASKTDPTARQRFARQLAHFGHHEEALEHFLWCFDHGPEHDPSYAAARSSFLVSDLSGLANKYEPAGVALEERAQAALQRLLGDAPTVQDAAVFSAVYRTTGRLSDLMSVYKQLVTRETGRAVLAPLIDDLLPDLVRTREYELLLAGVVEPVERVRQDIANFAAVAEELRNQPHRPATFFRQKIVRDGAFLYEALLATGAQLPALEISDELLAFSPIISTYQMLILHSYRAGVAFEAEALYHRGLAQLPPQFRPMLNQLTGRPPNANAAAAE